MPSSVKNVTLEQCCIDALKLIDDKQSLGDSTRSLFTWAPLAFIASDPNPLGIIITVLTSDWDTLAGIAVGLEKIKYLAIVNDCRLEEAIHNNEASLKKFWAAMAEFYQAQADAVS